MLQSALIQCWLCSLPSLMNDLLSMRTAMSRVLTTRAIALQQLQSARSHYKGAYSPVCDLEILHCSGNGGLEASLRGRPRSKLDARPATHSPAHPCYSYILPRVWKSEIHYLSSLGISFWRLKASAKNSHYYLCVACNVRCIRQIPRI